MTHSTTIALFRIEGVLLKPSPWQAAAWLAAQSQRMRDRMFRLGGATAALSLRWQGENDRSTRLAWAALRGMSEDRIRVLGEEYFEARLDGQTLARGEELLGAARKRFDRVILVTEHIEEVIGPWAASVGIDDLWCHRLEYRDHRATGHLLSGPTNPSSAALTLGQFARSEGIDLMRSAGYGSVEGDVLWLSQLGLPCAAMPDGALRRHARAMDWPLVERS